MSFAPKEINQLKILREGHEVAVLTRTRDGCEVSSLSDGSDGKERPLSFHLNLANGPLYVRGVNLPTYFAGLLPEGLRLRALTRKIKTSEDDLFSILVASGFDPVGDLYFEKLKSDETGKLPENFNDLKRNLRSQGDLTQRPLAGVQEKVSAERLSLPVRLPGRRLRNSYILKLGSSEFPDLIRNEYYCLKLAEQCGIETCMASIIEDESGEEGLLVTRFDRQWDARKKTFIRFHQEDACQFLDRYPADKYNITVREIAEGIARYTDAPKLELLNFLRQYAFSYLIGNGDLHGKNISLLQRGRVSATKLAPAYDLVCTFLYGDSSMALKLDGKDKNLKRKAFVDFGERFELPPLVVEKMLDRLLERFQKYRNSFFQFSLANKRRSASESMMSTRLKHLS